MGNHQWDDEKRVRVEDSPYGMGLLHTCKKCGATARAASLYIDDPSIWDAVSAWASEVKNPSEHECKA